MEGQQQTRHCRETVLAVEPSAHTHEVVAKMLRNLQLELLEEDSLYRRPSSTSTCLRDISHSSALSVSSAKQDHPAACLLDGSVFTYWQSDEPQPHTITLQFAKLTPIVAVRVFLNHLEDDSYTPRDMLVSAGPDVYSLVTIAKVQSNEPVGWVTIPLHDNMDPSTILHLVTPEPSIPSLLTALDNEHFYKKAHTHEDSREEILKKHKPLALNLRTAIQNPLQTYVIQITILSNYQNGRDCHVRLVQALTSPKSFSLEPEGFPPFSSSEFKNCAISLR